MGGTKKLTPEQYQERIHKKHGDKVSLILHTYTNSATKAQFIDKIYGEFWAYPSNVLHQGNKHPDGKGPNSRLRQTASIEKVKEDIFVVHKDTVVIVESTYKNYHTHAMFVDRDYGEFRSNLAAVVGGKQRHPEYGRLQTSIKQQFPTAELWDKAKLQQLGIPVRKSRRKVGR